MIHACNHPIWLAAALIPLLQSSAVAYLDPFDTRTLTSENGEYVLVLLTPPAERGGREYDPTVGESLNDEEINAWKESYARQLAIEKKYPRSGLYRNDGSTKLLWPIHYIAVCKDIYVANDGNHLVVAFLEWDLGNVSSRGDALEFYSRGKQLAAYNEDALLNGWAFKCMTGNGLDLGMPTCREATLNHDAATFEIETNHGEVFRFDVATGQIIHHWSPWPIYLGIPLIATPAGIWALRRRKNRRGEIVAAPPCRGKHQFSMRELLGIMTLVGFCIAVANRYGSFGAALSLIVSLGAAIAARRSNMRRAWLIGSVLALYGAYVAVLIFVLADCIARSLNPTLPYWWVDGWGFVAPLGMIAVFALTGAVVAGAIAKN